jgi:opacity protein-like surface antigen
MLRILIVATLLVLISATSAWADAPTAAGTSGAASGDGVIVPLEIGARIGAQAFLQPAVRASMPSAVMQRTINGVVQAQGAADGRGTMFTVLGFGGDKQGLGLPVSETVTLGLRYQYLRPEDIRRDVAETASLDDEYTSHNLVLRARWHF